MEALSGTWSVIAMFILRLGVPLVVMAVVVYLFRRLDAKWQSEAWERWHADLVQEQEGAGASWLARLTKPCWQEHGCAESAYRKCPAYTKSNLPCWMARRLAEGSLPTKCYNCERFAMAPGHVR
jgi:hypothetical protein